MVFTSDAVTGRVALITGGGSGIGFGIAKALALAGARVAIASRNIDRLENAAAEIRRSGGEVITVQMDVRSFDDVQNAVNITRDTFGALDIVIANEPVAEWPQTAGMERSADGWDVAQPSHPAAGLS